MSVPSWAKDMDDQDLSEITTSSLRMLDEDGQKRLLFAAIRACELNAIRSILQVNRNLIQAKMFGYEGSDVFEIIKESKTKRCYFYTGQEKDGFFYPLHVATEAGHKNLTVLLVRAGADVGSEDYRGCIAEEKCTGDAYHAFYELQGLKFEPVERFQGKTDRSGKRTGQGVLFFKPEGYEIEEKQLYRGTFKNDMYHGHGTLYWPGQDSIQYIGRFKGGMKHGRGIEFDEQGKKIYQGTFRDDKREGRGEEYNEDVRTYKGEFSENVRHGFGVAYFGESAKYFGRYEGGVMCGVGIYCHPNGDRFEGMFFNNRPDGPGSFYELDHYTGNATGSHAVWQAGRKIKDSNFPFVPTSADLPDYDGKEIMTEIMNYAGMSSEEAEMSANTTAAAVSHDLNQIKEDEEEEDEDEDEEVDTTINEKQQVSNHNHGTGSSAKNAEEALSSSSTSVKTNQVAMLQLNGILDNQGRPFKRTFAFFDGDGCMNTIAKGDIWKVQLGKYLKLPLKEAITLGLRLPPEIVLAISHRGGSNSGELGADGEEEGDGDRDASGTHGAGGDDEEDSDVEMEEVTGYHFMDCVPLFVSYIYVNSAGKVFEDRLVNRGLRAEFPDFEAVYHLVIDAVDHYNEDWEKAFKEQEQLKLDQASGLVASSNGQVGVEAKRKVFMTDKEKKEQLILKQRAELAIKKGTAELPIEVERQIELEVLDSLEAELSKLLVEEQQEGRAKLGSTFAGAEVGRSQFSLQGAAQIKLNALTSSSNSGATTSLNNNSGNSSTPHAEKKKHRKRLSHTRYSDGKNTYDTTQLNIDDLFDIFMSPENPQLIQAEFSDDGSDHSSGAADDELLLNNEFAAELLYIMRTAVSVS